VFPGLAETKLDIQAQENFKYNTSMEKSQHLHYLPLSMAKKPMETGKILFFVQRSSPLQTLEENTYDQFIGPFIFAVGL